MSIEEEAKAYLDNKKPKKKKLSAADRTVMRAYMSSYVAALLSSSRAHSHREVLEEAYKHATLCLEFEKDNF